MFIPTGYRLLEPNEILKEGDLGAWADDLERPNITPYIWNVYEGAWGRSSKSYFLFERHFRKLENTPRGNKRIS